MPQSGKNWSLQLLLRYFPPLIIHWWSPKFNGIYGIIRKLWAMCDVYLIWNKYLLMSLSDPVLVSHIISSLCVGGRVWLFRHGYIWNEGGGVNNMHLLFWFGEMRLFEIYDHVTACNALMSGMKLCLEWLIKYFLHQFRIIYMIIQSAYVFL